MTTPPSKSTYKLNLPDAPATPTAVTGEARQKRLESVNFARGSVRLEGFVLTEEVEELNTRYVDGELSIDEHISAILALYTVD